MRTLATDWMARGSNPAVEKVLRTRPDRLSDPPNLLYSEYRVIPGGKEHGELNHPPPPSTYVKERVELYLYSSLGLHGLS